jgi:hypothetical protein
MRRPETAPEGAQRVVGPLAPLLERRAQQVELLAQRAHLHPEHQPVAEDAVECP